MVFASAYRKTTGASTLKTGHVCGSLLIRGWKREMEGGSVMARTIGCAVLLWCRTSDASLHEPRVWSPGFSRSGPPEGGTPYRWHDPDGFMVPMHGIEVVGAIHEPPFRPRRPHRPRPRLRGLSSRTRTSR